MKKNILLALSQPTFLPWSGYFDLIDTSDIFIFLDDAQFLKRSWHHRNKIILDTKSIWLTLPVNREKRFQLINQTKIFNEKKNLEKIIKKIQHSYSKSEYFDLYFDEFRQKFNQCLSLNFINKINVELIKWFMSKIGINSNIYNSSELNVSGARSYKITNICEKFNCLNYLSSPGTKEYLKEDIEIYKEKKIDIYIQNYNVKKYKQISQKFDGYVSILDLLFNEGPKTLSVLRNGRKEPEKLNI